MCRILLICLWFTADMALSADPLHRQIDRHIAARAGGSVAGAADDAEFFRRVRLDLAGDIPTVYVGSVDKKLYAIFGR